MPRNGFGLTPAQVHRAVARELAEHVPIPIPANRSSARRRVPHALAHRRPRRTGRQPGRDELPPGRTLAALARHNLKGLDQALARRREQAHQLYELVGETPGLTVHAPVPEDTPNGYSALWRVGLDRPRDFSARLAEAGVANSVGTYRLRAAHQHPACQDLSPAECPRAAEAVDRMLAVTLQLRTTEADLYRVAETIRREAKTWAEGR
ncbi:DegT/DnrJ/EryC1/StrS family aminotransferase [Streptomyces nigrescens]|uniref:DegT/DnrJ/EryC1/StrS family aminotransferase n=1 Tax=Streptomyces nigrescens TaxID=1920 RepID=UPI0036FD9A51